MERTAPGQWVSAMEKLEAVFAELAEKRTDTVEHLRENDREPPMDAARLKDWAARKLFKEYSGLAPQEYRDRAE